MREERIAYFDEDYPTSWINRELSKKLADELEHKGFKMLSAGGLRDWIIERIEQERARNTLAVFLQDVAPDTILDRFTPEALVTSILIR